ncbi:TolC family protein [Sphingomonas sp. 28-62-11]|uniref:TolC family protein n=1 Tax=Sphingomonas sp. 28-62-11 TaxID=1970432 RepID=UPI0035A859FC
MADAQEAAAPIAVRTLHDAVEVAVQQSSEAASLPALRAQAEALRRSGRGPFVGPPVLSVDLLTRSQGIIEEETSVSAGIRWPGEGKAIRSYAGRAGDSAQSGIEAARLRIAGDVRDAWWSLAAARAAVAVDRDQVGIAATTASQVARLVGAGEQARRDLLLAQAEASAAESRLSQAQAELARAEAAYAALAGPPPAELPPESQANVTDPENSPALRAALDRAALADARATSLTYGARLRLEGTVGIRRERGGVGDSTLSPEPFRNALLLGVRVPLGRNQSAVADAASARSTALGAGAEANRLRIRLVAEQRAAQARLDAAERSLEQAQARRAALAEALALTERGRTEGEIGFIEALRARQTLSEAERDLAAARVARFAAISSFNQAMGVLP